MIIAVVPTIIVGESNCFWRSREKVPLRPVRHRGRSDNCVGGKSRIGEACLEGGERIVVKGAILWPTTVNHTGTAPAAEILNVVKDL